MYQLVRSGKKKFVLRIKFSKVLISSLTDYRFFIDVLPVLYDLICFLSVKCSRSCERRQMKKKENFLVKKSKS